MEINVFQAALLGLFACLASMPGLGGTSIGNYTLGRPLVAGLVVGIILGDITLGIIVGMAIQVVYIALVTPGGTVSADVRAACYIGIPLAMIAIKGNPALAADPSGADAAALATTLGATCGTLGAILFYGTATINLAWQAMGWKWLEKGDTHKLYLVDMVLPWISHIVCSFGLAASLRRYRHPAQAGHHQGHRLPAVLLRLHARGGHGLQPHRLLRHRLLLRAHQVRALQDRVQAREGRHRRRHHRFC